MIVEPGDKVRLATSSSPWSGAEVIITSIDDRKVFTIYNFEVMDKSLPEHDSRSSNQMNHPHMGATPYLSDFLEV